MAEESVNVQLGGSTVGLQTAMREGARAVQEGREKIGESLEEMSVVTERVANKMEHLSVSIAFASNALAEGSERGVGRAAHALAGLGFAFGPVAGGLATAIAIATERMVEFFHKAQEEAEKTREKMEQEIGQLANTGQAGKLRQKMQELLYGNPYDEKGKAVAVSKVVAGAFEGSLADLETRMAQLDAKLPKGATMAPADIADEYNKVSRALSTAREQFEELKKAMEALKSQPAEMSGLLPVHSTAKRDETPEEEQKRWDEAIRHIKGELESFGKRTESMSEATLKKSMDDDIRAANESIQEDERARKAKEDSRRAFWKFVEEIDAQGAAAEEKRVRDLANEWNRAFGVITGSWNTAVQRLQSGTDTVRNFWRDMWHDIVRNSIASLIQIQEAHAAHWLAVHNITVASVAKDVALVVAGAVKKIAAYAAEAAAAAWAAISAIPYVGPFLAPAVAAATLAGVLALAGGIGGGGGGGGGGSSASAASASGGGATHNYYISALDHQSFHDAMMRNAPSVAKAAAVGASSGIRLPGTPGRGSL